MADDRVTEIHESARNICAEDGQGFTVFNVWKVGSHYTIVLTVPGDRKRDWEAAQRLSTKLLAEIKDVRVTIDITPGA
jgi:hypothetical protein